MHAISLQSKLIRSLVGLTVLSSVAFAAAETRPDAEILLWEQHWTLNDDGSTVYEEKLHTQLNSDRTYGELADPRMTYHAENDELEILVARVKRPDGTYRELPEYSHVKVSPNASEGWPAYAGIRQHLLVMSGVEPGCVTELEYRITSQPGTQRPLARDVRLDAPYPVHRRVVSVTVPEGTEYRAVLSNLPDKRGAGAEPDWVHADDEHKHAHGSHGEHQHDQAAEVATQAKRWQFADLPAVPREPQSPPWQRSCARFAFSTVPGHDEWTYDRLQAIELASGESPLIRELATEWVEGEHADADKLRRLQEKLVERFNVVDFPVDWQPPRLRRAPDLMETNYGLEAEAAALLLSLARAAGLAVEPGLLVANYAWRPCVAQESMVAANVVVLSDSQEIWHPQRGQIDRQEYPGHTLMLMHNEEVEALPLSAWSKPHQSQIIVRGDVDVKADATFTGALDVVLTGLFVPASDVRTERDRERLAKRVVQAVLPAAKVTNVDERTVVGGSRLEMQVSIESSDPLEVVHTARRLQLGEQGPYHHWVHLPLNHANRHNYAWLTGAFDQQIDLRIEWPEDWSVDVLPSKRFEQSGDWGVATQRVTTTEHGLTLNRRTRLSAPVLSPEAVLSMRAALNNLRCDFARTLVLKPAD